MKVGAFGSSLVLRVSDRKVLTFQNMKREITGQWGSMERIGKKPLPVFQGPALQTMTLEIVLDASLGVKPRAMLKKIEKLVERGTAEILVIGKKRVGENAWVIKKSSESWARVLQRGELLRAKVGLTLQEYI